MVQTRPQSEMTGPIGGTASKHFDGPPSKAQKDLMKLEKKLREIVKIEALLRSGQQVDPLQREKASQRDFLEAKLAQVKREILEAAEAEGSSDESTCSATSDRALEEEAHGDESTSWDSPPLSPSAWPATASAAAPPQQLQVQPGASGSAWPACAAAAATPACSQIVGPQTVQLVPQMGQMVPQMGQMVFVQQPMEAPVVVQCAPAQFAPAWQVMQVMQVPYCGVVQHQQYCSPAPADQPPAAGHRAPARGGHSSRPGAGRGGAGHARRMHEAPRDARTSPDRCEELKRLLESDDTLPEERTAAIASLKGSVRQLATACKAGSQAVQAALKWVGNSGAPELLQELHGHVEELIKSPFGNYVIQAVVSDMAPSLAGFVVIELQGHADYFARHHYGCRVLCRLLEHSDSPGWSGSLRLIDEVVAKAESMCRHAYAHHVLEQVLERGEEWQKQRVRQALLSDPAKNAQDRYAAFVLQAALGAQGQATEELAAMLLHALGGPHAGATLLARTRSGARVVESLAQVPGSRQAVLEALSAADVAHALKQTKHGQKLLEKVQ